MAALHIVNRFSALTSCLEVAASDDSVLLIQDAVYALTQAPPRVLLAIAEDVRARGLESRLQEDVRLVDYAEFVDLTVTHQPLISWD
jgi:tRNA 2-thiouridine synthesizing protein B